MKTSSISDSKAKKIIMKIAAILFWVAAWFALYYSVDSNILLSSPLQTFVRLVELGKTAEFWTTAGMSLVRITLGFLCGVAAGTLLAVITASGRLLYELFQPLLTVIKTTPVASFILLALVWIKRDTVPAFISFLMVLPIMWANVTEGIKNSDMGLLEVAKVYRFSLNKKIKHIYIPSVKSYFFAGCTTAMGLAWKAGVAAEVLSQPASSIGNHLYASKIYLETTDLFAWTTVVIILSVILEKILKKLIGRIKGK